MHIFKYIVIFTILVLVSGCAYPGRIYYGNYTHDKAVQKAYRDEIQKFKVEEESVAKCVARNQARIDMGLYPGYFCGSSYYGYGGYGGYGGQGGYSYHYYFGF